MCTGEVTAVAPLTSPEEPPATSCAVVFLPSPICLSVAWGPLVSHRAKGRSQPGLRRVWATPAPAYARVLWATVPSGRPNSRVGFQIYFWFILFTDLCIDSKICIS